MEHDGNDLSPQKMFVLELTDNVRIYIPIGCLVSASFDPNPDIKYSTWPLNENVFSGRSQSFRSGTETQKPPSIVNWQRLSEAKSEIESEALCAYGNLINLILHKTFKNSIYHRGPVLIRTDPGRKQLSVGMKSC